MKIKVLNDTAISPNLTEGLQNVACAFPAACRMETGELLCVYRQGKEKHSHDGVLVVQKSVDGGINWSEPTIVHDGTKRENPESVLTQYVYQVTDGTILVMFTTTAITKPEVYLFSEEGKKLRKGLYVAKSKDGGTTWHSSEPRNPVVVPPNFGIISRPFLLPNGEFFIPFEGTNELNQEILFGAISSDGDLTNPFFVTCAFDQEGKLGYGDSRFTVLPDSRIIMLAWTWTYDTEETQPVHKCISMDNGRNWSRPISTGVKSQIMSPLALNSEQLIAAGNARTTSQPGIRLWFSLDTGETWNTDTPIQMWDANKEKMGGLPLEIKSTAQENIATGIWNELRAFSFGSPELLRLEENLFLLTYYAKIKNILHVRCCQFEIIEL